MDALEDHDYPLPVTLDSQNIHSCNQCWYQSKSLLLIKSHIKRHTSAKLFNCALKSRPKLKVVSKNLGILNSYVCRCCSFKTYSLIVYMKHVFSCRICMEHNYCEESADRQYECELCTFLTGNLRTMWQHILHHTGHRKKIDGFFCDICSYRNNHEMNTLRHIFKRHTNVNKFVNGEDTPIEMDNVMYCYCGKCSHVHIYIKDGDTVKKKEVTEESENNYENEIVIPEEEIDETSKLKYRGIVKEEGITQEEQIENNNGENETAMPEEVWFDANNELYISEERSVDQYIVKEKRVIEAEKIKNNYDNEIAMPEQVWFNENNELCTPEHPVDEISEFEYTTIVKEKHGTEEEENENDYKIETAIPEEVWLNEHNSKSEERSVDESSNSECRDVVKEEKVTEEKKSENYENEIAMPEELWFNEHNELPKSEERSVDETSNFEYRGVVKEEKTEEKKSEIAMSEEAWINENNERSAEFECAGCSYRADSEEKLSEHIFRPLEVNAIYECSQCSHVTPHVFLLKYHTLTNHRRTGELQYECKECTFKSNQIFILLCHLFSKHSHCMENHVLCTFEVCGDLKKEEKSPLDVKNRLYRCEGCSYTDYSKTKVEEHVFKVHTNGEQYKPVQRPCTYCSYTTSTKKELKYHKLKEHP